MYRIGVVRYLRLNKPNSLHLARKYAWIFVFGHYLIVSDHVQGQISREHIAASNGGYCLFATLCKYGMRALDFLGRFHFCFSLVFYILGAFLIKQFFHSRLLDI